MDQIIQEAEELLVGKYRFNNPWDMECCDQAYSLVNGHTYYTPNGDPEWVYMFSRMEYMRKLVLAYGETSDKKYIDSYLRGIQLFYDENNIISGSLPKEPGGIAGKVVCKLKFELNNHLLHKTNRMATYRTLDTAIRNYTLLCDLFYTRVLYENCEYKEFLIKKLDEDMPFTIEKLSDFDEYSNWGLIRLTLYVACTLLLGNSNIDTELGHIHRMLKKQIRGDGGHIECSIMYHMQVLICLLRMLFQMKRGGCYDQQIAECAESMCRYAYHLADTSNNQVMYGDSDITCIDTVMAIAESVLGLNYRMHLSEPTDKMLLYEFPGIQIDNSKPLLEKANRVFLDGIYVVNDRCNQIRCFNETTRSNHKHADNGSIVFYRKGVPVFIDTGRCTYHDVNKREYFKGIFGHCIATIDNGAEWEFVNKWRFLEHPEIIENSVTKSGAALSYKFNTKSIFHKRCLYIKDDILIVSDIAECDGHHVLSSIWNIAEQTRCEIVGEQIILHVGDEKLFLKTFPHARQQELKTGKLSPHYNLEFNSGNQLIFTTEFSNYALSVMVLSAADIYSFEDINYLTFSFKNKHIKVNKTTGDINT